MKRDVDKGSHDPIAGGAFGRPGEGGELSAVSMRLYLSHAKFIIKQTKETTLVVFWTWVCCD